jgi:thiol-disulfide isomerase/thioredoxin
VRSDVEMTAANRLALAQITRRSRIEERAGASLSGGERDHLFLSDRGAQFTDIAGVAGLDDPADGRAFGILDYDRDGWLDLAVVNSNAPMLELFRNQIGCHSATARPSARGRMIALRFVGGNHTAQPATSGSARDGFGAKVTVDLGGLTILRENRAGEGFAAQNSATMRIGIGAREVAPSVTVRWPTGHKQMVADVPEGTLLTVYENPAQSPTGEAFVREDYVKASPARDTAVARPPVRPRLPLAVGAADKASDLRVFTTMATWCTACKGEMPQFRRLRAAFGPRDVGLFGVPIDPSEGPTQIKAWGAANRPAYGLLMGLSETQVASVKSLVLDQMKLDAVPASIVTDAAGNVLLTQWGPPSISKLRELLAAVRSEGRSSPALRCGN